VWGSSGSDVFAVGHFGAIVHYDGSSWSTMTSGTTESLYGVWGSGGSDVFAVGWGGTILHYDGASWSTMPSGTTTGLYDLWGSSGSDVFAVGGDWWDAGGTVLHYDGDTWSPMSSGAGHPLYGVWGSSGNDVFAVGAGGTILHYGEPVAIVYVPVDIKPGSCPNPIRANEKGALPVAILGFEGFDAACIDPGSVELEGVSPLHWAMKDVATPFEPYIGKQDARDCTRDGLDGYIDLNLKFGTQEVIAALGEVGNGDVLVLSLTGTLKQECGGLPFEGEDVVIIRQGR
jgi:hypothetical protein